MTPKSSWEVYKESLKTSVENTPARLDRAVDSQDQTLTAMGSVAKNWHKTFMEAVKGPKKVKGAPPLRPDQKAAQTVRRAQQVVASITGLYTMGQDMLNVGFATLTAPIAALFPSLPAATIMATYIGVPHAHAHPPSLIPPAPPVPLPSLGPVMFKNSVQVLIGGMPAARCGDLGLAPTCGGFLPFFIIKTGSSNTFIGGARAARITDFCQACTKKVPDAPIPAGKFMAAVGKAAEVAGDVMGGAAKLGGALAVAADISEAAAEDDAAMASAKAMSAAMGAAQMAADIAGEIIENLMGNDPGIPPGGLGAIAVPTQANVLIGGFPMIDIPNPADLLLKKLKRYKAKKKPAKSKKSKTKPKDCPG